MIDRKLLTATLASVLLLTSCDMVSSIRSAEQPTATLTTSLESAEEKAAREAAEAEALAASAAVQAALAKGMELYDKGDYNNVVTHLNGAAELWTAETAVQVEALKYMAFSYCLTGRRTLCRQTFQRALDIDANFDLAPGEKGHPLWSPEFDRVKNPR